MDFFDQLATIQTDVLYRAPDGMAFHRQEDCMRYMCFEYTRNSIFKRLNVYITKEKLAALMMDEEFAGIMQAFHSCGDGEPSMDGQSEFERVAAQPEIADIAEDTLDVDQMLADLSSLRKEEK